jgi:hypothetical protein
MDEHESRQHGGAQMNSIDGQGVDTDDTGTTLEASTTGGAGDLEGSGDGDTGSDLASGLGNATPGAGSNWTPGRTSSAGSSNPVLGGEDTERMSGSWGNRSGSGSGGQGEAEMTEDGTTAGTVSEDVTGSAGTNG